MQILPSLQYVVSVVVFVLDFCHFLSEIDGIWGHWSLASIKAFIGKGCYRLHNSVSIVNIPYLYEVCDFCPYLDVGHFM